MSRFRSWWIEDGQHDQDHYGELSLTYQCQKIGSPSHHRCCFQVQSRNKATPNSFKIWRRTSCSIWSIDGEEQFMFGNSMGTITWNLNFSVQRDIWDGHSFHQILLFLIFTFHVVIVGRHVFWRKNTQWPLLIVQCFKYALFLISGTSIGTVHDIL